MDKCLYNYTRDTVNSLKKNVSLGVAKSNLNNKFSKIRQILYCRSFASNNYVNLSRNVNGENVINVFLTSVILKPNKNCGQSR